jgi:glycosyltransferase involved in cell wall biosynthesis
MVTTFYPPYAFGGDAVYVQQLSNELAKRGHQVEVVYCRDAYNFLANRLSEVAEEDHPNVRVHGLRSPFRFLSPLGTHQTGRPLFKASRIQRIFEKSFDVIHYHNISLVGGPQILRCGQGLKLYTLHEYWLLCPTHMLFRFNREVCTHKSCLLCTLIHRRPPQLWRYTGAIKAAVKHVDVFIAPSKFTKNKHLEMGLKIPIVELPHFTSRWASHEHTEQPMTGESSYFLFVGRLEKIKGLHTVLPVFRHYQKAELWIAGTGEYEPVLRRMAEGAPNIRFLGDRSGEELRSLYRGAVATIVPSMWYEVFGIVILEAFSQSTPVIVRNRGAMPDLIEESCGGFVFDTENELLFAMDRLLEDPNLRNEIGLRGYDAFHRKWSAEVHIERYLAIVAQGLTARRDKPPAEKAL